MGVQSNARLVVTYPSGAKQITYWGRPVIAGIYVVITDALAGSGVVDTIVELQHLEHGQYRTKSLWDRSGRRRAAPVAAATRGEG